MHQTYAKVQVSHMNMNLFQRDWNSSSDPDSLGKVIWPSHQGANILQVVSGSRRKFWQYWNNQSLQSIMPLPIPFDNSLVWLFCEEPTQACNFESPCDSSYDAYILANFTIMSQISLPGDGIWATFTMMQMAPWIRFLKTCSKKQGTQKLFCAWLWVYTRERLLAISLFLGSMSLLCLRAKNLLGCPMEMRPKFLASGKYSCGRQQKVTLTIHFLHHILHALKYKIAAVTHLSCRSSRNRNGSIQLRWNVARNRTFSLVK